MAPDPYTFDLNIDNELESEYPIHFARHDTYMPLDGTTEVTPHLQDNQGVTITKSDGRDGLSTTLSFWVGGDSEEEAKLKFDVYCEMPASDGSSIPHARLGDCTHLESGMFHDGWRSNLYSGKNDNDDEIGSREGVNISGKLGNIVPKIGNTLPKIKGVPDLFHQGGNTSWRIPIGDLIEQNGVRVQLRDRDLEYPHSKASIVISGYQD
ncbi:hypothetical protein V8F06_004155 [Rhypophila decipiens]